MNLNYPPIEGPSGFSPGGLIPDNPPRQTQVAEQAQRLEVLAQELLTEIGAFGKRLACVTNPYPATPLPPEKERETLVPLAENLRVTGNYLDGAISSLQLLAQSIELP